MALTLILDQVTKWWAEGSLDATTSTDLLPILALQLTHNPGIAFSFFMGSNSDILLGAVVLITVVVLVLWVRATDGGKLATIGFGLIVGGAIGNIVDRIFHGEVVDFLRLHFGSRDLFVFNLADFALTLGPIILVIAFLWGPRKPAERSPSS